MSRVLGLIALCVIGGACVTGNGQGTSSSNAPAARPKLILQITVDQLRADLPRRFYDRFGEGGFRYLMERGIRYDNAHHGHANTETVVGHTTLATGADPATHGMVANVWFDHSDGSLRYNVEDPRYHLLTAGAAVDQDAEIDPTQKTAKTDGRSPAAILRRRYRTFAARVELLPTSQPWLACPSVVSVPAAVVAATLATWINRQREES